jgi:hypothetical protein
MTHEMRKLMEAVDLNSQEKPHEAADEFFNEDVEPDEVQYDKETYNHESFMRMMKSHIEYAEHQRDAEMKQKEAADTSDDGHERAMYYAGERFWEGCVQGMKTALYFYNNARR